MRNRFIIIFICLSLLAVVTINAHADYGQLETRVGAVNGILKGSSLLDEPSNTELLLQFDDLEVINTLEEYQKETLAVMIDKGIISGYTDNTLRPFAPLTRAEYAVMLFRAQPYFDELPKLVEYFVPYSDVSGWNAEAIRFCMEHGLMMGNGTTFGVDDTLTKEQTDIVQRRMQYGLNTEEKYILLSLNGASPLDMTKVNQSANDRILKPEGREIDTRCPLAEKEVAIELLKEYISTAYSFNYQKCDSDEKLMQQAKRIDKYSELSIGQPIYRTDEIYKVLKENQNSQYVAESFFITNPDLFWWGGWQSAHFRYESIGYLYFKIDSGIERAAYNNLPVRYKSDLDEFDPADRPSYELELGKWYRQKITIYRYKDQRIYYIVSGSETIEPLPDDFYN